MTKITQLFQNLITNAIKFSRESVPRIIDINGVKKGQFIEFSIKDNGIGIPKENRRDVFLPFKKFHSRSEGSMHGIGLSLCKKIIENHGGKISVNSQENVGTTFKFSLPAKKE